MKYLIFFLLIIFLPLKADEVNEEIIFQEKSFSQNNIISSIKSEETLLKLINSTENNNNFFYSLFDPLTNNIIYPEYSNENDFFFEKINLFNKKNYRYQINSNLFEKVIFEEFQNPNAETFTPDPKVMVRKSALSAVQEDITAATALLQGTGGCHLPHSGSDT